MNVNVVSSARYCAEEDRRDRLFVLLNQEGGNPSQLLELLCTVVEREDWKRLDDGYGGPLAFRDYIARPRPVGIGWTREEALKFIELRHRREAGRNKDVDLIARLVEMRKQFRDVFNAPLAPVGAPAGNQNAAKAPELTSECPVPVLRSDDKPIPFQPYADPPPVLGADDPAMPDGDGQASDGEENKGNNVTFVSESRRGNDPDYAIRRLKRDSPDLAEKVLRGEMSPHAAACMAGFRKKRIQVPAEPREAARYLVEHFDRDQMNELLDAIKDLIGD